MNENKLTPEAEAMIKSYSGKLYIPSYNDDTEPLFVTGMRRALTDPALLKAQQLYTREEAKPDRAKMIDLVATVIQNTDTPTTYTIVDALLNNWEMILPSPPKTEV